MTTPRHELWASLSQDAQRKYLAFERRVVPSSIKRRNPKDDLSPYILDRRCEELGNAGRTVLRGPSTDGLEAGGGRTTTDAREAEQWAREYLLPVIWRERIAALQHADTSRITVAHAAEQYLESLAMENVLPDGSVVQSFPRGIQSRVSNVRRHVIPLFGPHLLVGLTRSIVRREIDAMQVEARRDGTVVRKCAAFGLKRRVVAALHAVWRHVFRDSEAAPFTGVQLEAPRVDANRGPVRAADLSTLQRDLRRRSKRGGLEPEDVRQALVGAMQRDLVLAARPNLADRYVVLTPHLFAVLVALGVRISEALRIRWCEINWKAELVVVHQAKLRANPRSKPKPDLRIVPLQRSLVPWLEELRRMQGITDPENSTAFLFQLVREHPGRPTAAGQGGADGRPASTDAVGARCAKALQHAGVKPERYATHWGRATHSSWGKYAPGVKAEELKHFLGHRAFDGTTEDYLSEVIALLREEHRTYIALPSPDEVRALLPQFTPVKYDWRAARPYAQSPRGPSGRRRWTKSSP